MSVGLVGSYTAETEETPRLTVGLKHLTYGPALPIGS